MECWVRHIGHAKKQYQILGNYDLDQYFKTH